MKVEGPGKTSGAKGVSKTGPKKSGDGAFDAMIGETEEAAQTAATARPSAVGALDALLALQGAGDEEARKKAKKRGLDILDQLDKIKIGLLTGEIPRSTLQQLSQIIASHREEIMDPKLVEILDEIDLRAQIELAKLEL